MIWSLNIPQLHNTGDVPRWKDPADVVEVSDVEAAVGSTSQSERSEEFVSFSLTVTAGTGDAAAAPIS